MTPHLGALAKAGITLERHHTYMYCSPTRRSILSGRFPVHITGVQAPVCSNYLCEAPTAYPLPTLTLTLTGCSRPLEFTLLSGKLKQATPPYETHFVGKGHLGYHTTDHLPVNRGFDSHVGYLNAAEDYHYGNKDYYTTQQCAAWASPDNGKSCEKDMWHDHGPGSDIVDQIYYSANFCEWLDTAGSL